MNILEVPFNQFLGLEKSERQDFTFKLEQRPELLNHLGTMHACVQLSLAEAVSGEYLLNQFYSLRNDVIPVVRKTEVKYQKPANGCLYAKADFFKTTQADILKTLNEKGRALVPIKVEVVDAENKRTLIAVFDWFVAKK